jgi:hypothetical protein
MPRPCTCDLCDLTPGASYTLEQCRFCFKFHHDDIANRAWGGPGLYGRRRYLPCRHLGEATGRTHTCSSCGTSKDHLVRACNLHGECLENTAAPGLRCCRICKDREPVEIPDPFEGKEPVRNLLFHIMPVRGNGIWQRRVSQLVKRIRLFNGRRVVAIVTGPTWGPCALDPPEYVRDAFGGAVHEFIEVPNDPNLREVATFEPLFERVETPSARQVTLYAHAKGVTRPGHPTCQEWADVLYETMLDYWPLVEVSLRDYPITGSFLRGLEGWPGQSASTYHYSGSWFWFRNRDLFQQDNWRQINSFWSGIEPYPSLRFPITLAGCLFHPFYLPGPGLYDPTYWYQRVVPDLERFRRERQADKKEW